MAFSKIVAGVFATGMVLATGMQALAADNASGPARNFNPAWHKQMCADRFAHNAGRMAYIEAKLSLTDSQRPLFEQWKQTVLASAKAQEGKCLAREQHAGRHNILERQAHMMQRLQSRMADMTAERPSLEALYNALSPEQKQLFDRGNRMDQGGRGPQGHGDWHDHASHSDLSDKA